MRDTASTGPKWGSGHSERSELEYEPPSELFEKMKQSRRAQSKMDNEPDSNRGGQGETTDSRGTTEMTEDQDGSEVPGSSMAADSAATPAEEDANREQLQEESQNEGTAKNQQEEDAAPADTAANSGGKEKGLGGQQEAAAANLLVEDKAAAENHNNQEADIAFAPPDSNYTDGSGAAE